MAPILLYSKIIYIKSERYQSILYQIIKWEEQFTFFLPINKLLKSASVVNAADGFAFNGKNITNMLY